MALAAELYLDSRGNMRRDVGIDATIRDQYARPVDVTITNLSRSGFAVDAALDLTVGEELGIGIAGIGIRPAEVVWRSGQLYGCRFTQPLTQTDFEKALVAESVVAADFAQMPTPDYDTELSGQPEVYKLPRPARVAVIVGLSGALWGGIILAARAIF